MHSKENRAERTCITMKNMKVIEVAIDDGAFVPSRAHAEDAGLDLYAMDTQIVPAKESAIFDTGVHVKIPKGRCGLLVSKSGLNTKHGITSTGLIDAGYDGSIVVKLYNHSGYDYKVERGNKISQLVILPVETPDVLLVDSVEGGERGDNGFGSTGK
jgi:dUTP pyrophosphatase